MYVLPYGQMSLWGATVITNLMSAIPWVGQDIVELTIPTTILVTLRWLYIHMSYPITLPIIGKIHQNAFNKLKNNIKENEKDSFNIPSSFLAYFIGFVDGDGYIQVTETTKGFIAIKLVISLDINDIATLEYFKSVLKVGIISVYKDVRRQTCKLVINRTDLQSVIFPLMLHHKIFFLTKTRIEQFNLAMYILREDIKLFSLVNHKDIPVVFNLPTTSVGYLDLHFFLDWISGFVAAEGSFFIKINNDGCFQIKQRIHENLFSAFKLVFETNRSITTDSNLYNQFGVSSKSDIQKVINFFSFSGVHPLMGHKYIQYIKWLEDLSNSKRYKNLHYPVSFSSSL